MFLKMCVWGGGKEELERLTFTVQARESWQDIPYSVPGQDVDRDSLNTKERAREGEGHGGGGEEREIQY